VTGYSTSASSFADIMSSDVAWAVVRNNSAFLLKKRNCPKPFSTDPLNLTNKYSQRYNGTVSRRALGLTAADKGLVLSVKAPNKDNKPAKNVIRTEMKSGASTAVGKVRSLTARGRYRKDLSKAALRRAAAILRSQRPLPANRKGARKAAASTKKND